MSILAFNHLVFSWNLDTEFGHWICLSFSLWAQKIQIQNIFLSQEKEWFCKAFLSCQRASVHIIKSLGIIWYQQTQLTICGWQQPMSEWGNEAVDQYRGVKSVLWRGGTETFLWVWQGLCLTQVTCIYSVFYSWVSI